MAKHGQIKSSERAWFYLVLFLRIWTFQWVTANPNNFFVSLAFSGSDMRIGYGLVRRQGFVDRCC
jgi:hypothetical protein